MVTYICMGIIVLFLAFEVLYKAKFQDVNNGFFDLSNTTAMRGFWCLVVILVHTPVMFQNTVQDMIGSFAYVGVTFFFMTSGYGLKLGIKKNPDSIKTFWRKRLPKLLIPYYLTGLFGALLRVIEGREIDWLDVLPVRKWVLWLLICYLFFWAVYRFNIGGKYKDCVIAVLVVAFSLVTFFLEKHIPETIWPTEVYGFIWGILLAEQKDSFRKAGVKNWLVKSAVIGVVAGILGVAYLKFKSVYFAGGYLLKIVLGVAILLFILQLTTRIGIGNRISLFLGGISYEIFLLHGHIFEAFEKFFPGLDSGVCILAVIIVVTGFSALLHLLGKVLIEKMRMKE